MRHVAQSFAGLTTTVSASFATWNSTYSTSFSAQIAASSSLIGREAFDRSVSPAQKRSKPPPVPLIPTVTSMPVSSRKPSAAAVTYGPTVLEPSAVTTLDDPPSSLPPHPAATSEQGHERPIPVQGACSACVAPLFPVLEARPTVDRVGGRIPAFDQGMGAALVNVR